MTSSSLRDLDEQLEELAKLKISTASRKIGPAVPPKPKKGSGAAVPQSYPIQGNIPSYSSPLHHAHAKAQNQLYSNMPPTPDLGDDPSYYNLPPPPPPIANQAIYCNINPSSNAVNATYANDPGVDDLPLPPPELAEYSNLAGLQDLPPPPSPVSSSYSELRRATHHTHHQPPLHSNYASDYAVYGGPTSASSTYESIYEPICPRPPSQMSSYSLYAPYASSTAGDSRHEKQVNDLTDLLVESMENPPDEDILGVCDKCKEYVINEGSGCTAMEKVYHIACFTCHVCKTPLKGEPFFALEGKPYCERDYLNTLEKCSVCMKPILDRILRATGKPYHPQCFTCVVCGQSLDMVPFTVDAANQIHCITDFHKKFAPRCCVCQQPIMPEPGKEETVRVVALDRSFHVSCYKCEDCGLILSSEVQGRGCYPLDDHVLCKNCNANRIQCLTKSVTVTDL